ncbi:response regulator [Rickettsiales endosymbiont of Stachyamoeba lipophora]|uniref:response regulator n=1 Tax=Rickettsiales endosymbiont of Stachyamoeba lipophora TaxID=2486578 RepID=UPI000F65115F|nr:response regulator [Rickettsiales endosymbiont of Stachyamoeba lipophora]AZL15412.1 response regulator [Rickettsiales endosymbiont of Stachyamoeba lipophora]
MAVDKDIPILIVDDYKTMLRIVKNFLNQLGFFNVEEATTGEAALNKLKEKKFGLIISDWNMEPMSGLDLLKKIRIEEALKDLPFVMMTEERGMVGEAQQYVGKNSYIVKPFNAEALKTQLVNILGGF